MDVLKSNHYWPVAAPNKNEPHDTATLIKFSLT